jgi:hypothetical protein
MDLSPQFWTLAISICGGVFIGGVAWGKHEAKLKDHDKVLLRIPVDKIMTEDRCRQYHQDRQETTDLKLEQIKASIDEIKEDRKMEKASTRLQGGSLFSKIDELIEKIEGAKL